MRAILFLLGFFTLPMGVINDVPFAVVSGVCFILYSVFGDFP